MLSLCYSCSNVKAASLPKTNLVANYILLAGDNQLFFFFALINVKKAGDDVPFSIETIPQNPQAYEQRKSPDR